MTINGYRGSLPVCPKQEKNYAGHSLAAPRGGTFMAYGGTPPHMYQERGEVATGANREHPTRP